MRSASSGIRIVSRAASAAERQVSENATATLNDGYRTLKDPIARAEYLLKEHGFDIGEQKSSNVPPELLEEVFELNMALEEIESSRPQLDEAEAGFIAMREELDRELDVEFAAYDLTQDRAVLERIQRPAESEKIHSESGEPSGESARMTPMQIDFGNTDPERIIGIDLGTTNSLVAYMDVTAPKVIPGEDGDRLVPSVVSLTPYGDDRRRKSRPPPADHAAGPHHLFGEAPDGPRRERCSGRVEAVPVPHRPGQRFRHPDSTGRKDLHAT